MRGADGGGDDLWHLARSLMPTPHHTRKYSASQHNLECDNAFIQQFYKPCLGPVDGN